MQNEIEATIQLDTLVLCCTSAAESNFRLYPDEAIHSFGNTVLIQSIDNSRRYKYCYNVNHDNNHIGKIKFGLYGQSHHDDKVWFCVNYKVFYNNTLQFLPTVFENLNLKLHNITRIHIALDSYNFNFEQNLRRNLKNKENRIKLMGKNITDRKKHEKRIGYWHSGSMDNPFKVRTIYIKNKRKIHYSKKENHKLEYDLEGEGTAKEPKTTIELIAYNKLEEIKRVSPYKTEFLDYHKVHNPTYKDIHREEIRLESEETRRYEQKHKKQITLTDLLDKTFLYAMFTEYIDRIIVIRDSKNNKIDLFPKSFLGSLEGKLPLTLPAPQNDKQFIEENFIEDKNIPSIKNDNKENNVQETIYRYKKNYIREMRKRQLSQETKNKISLSMKGSKNPNYGKKFSDDHKNKIRDSMLKYWSQYDIFKS